MCVLCCFQHKTPFGQKSRGESDYIGLLGLATSNLTRSSPLLFASSFVLLTRNSFHFIHLHCHMSPEDDVIQKRWFIGVGSSLVHWFTTRQAWFPPTSFLNKSCLTNLHITSILPSHVTSASWLNTAPSHCPFHCWLSTPWSQRLSGLILCEDASFAKDAFKAMFLPL